VLVSVDYKSIQFFGTEIILGNMIQKLMVSQNCKWSEGSYEYVSP